MSTRMVDRIIAATLYEGYILYPYRASSVKNQVRWTFGGVHPRAYSEASGGTEAWTAQTECLLRAGAPAQVDVTVRFLQLVTRTVARLDQPVGALDEESIAALQPVRELRVAGVTHRSWDEAVERDVECAPQDLGSLVDRDVPVHVVLRERREIEPLLDEAGLVCGALIRDTEPLVAEVVVGAERLADDLTRVRVVVRNETDIELTGSGDRDRALHRSLVSTHAILVTEGGTWLSLADPPDDAREAAAECRNVGLWPILIGEPGSEDTIVLASPIILDDHPQVAPESAGELFDSTEIDEILSLRILTLTDDEKAEMRSADDRARAMLERTEALTQEDLMRLHGTIRELRPVRGQTP